MENDDLVLLRSEADMIAMRLQKTEQELDRLRKQGVPSPSIPRPTPHPMPLTETPKP